MVVKHCSISDMGGKGCGGIDIVESEVKVRQSALSKHQRGGLGSGTYEVGERSTGKWSL